MIYPLFLGQSWLTSWGYRAKLPLDNDELMAWGNRAVAAIKSVNGRTYNVGPAGTALYLAGLKGYVQTVIWLL